MKQAAVDVHDSEYNDWAAFKAEIKNLMVETSTK